MAAQEILQLGSEILRQKAKRVPKGMRGLRKLTDKMFATMDAASGIGLAAPQNRRFTPRNRRRRR